MIPPEPLPLTLTPRVDIPFLFDSYRALIKDLGAMDGLAAAQTLASKHFIDAAAKLEDPQQFVRDLAVHYRVSTHFVDFPSVPAHLTQLLIVGTCQQAEAFLESFRRDQLHMGRTWRQRGDGEPRLKYTLDSISGGFATNYIRIRKERYEIFEYYRLVRNAFVHSSIDRDRVRREFDNVSDFRATVERDFGLPAPNPVADLTFADHMLFTRVTKYIATDLCRLAAPTTGQDLIRFLLSHPDKPRHPLTRMLNRKPDGEISRSGIRSFFLNRYNYRTRKFPTIEDEIVEWLGNLPNKHQRRDMRVGTILEYARGLIGASSDSS